MSEQPGEQVETRPTAAEAGTVNIHAVSRLLATPQRTAEARRAVPAPMTAPVIVCVVDTGMPIAEALNSMIEPPNDALKPWCCESRVIFVPIVSIIFQPPHAVPRPIAT